MPSEIAELRARLPGLMLRDQRRLGRRVGQAAGLREPAARERALRRVADDMDPAEARIEARRRAVPELSYPPELPVSQLKDEIAAVIGDHQVVIVAGETGSGKTTQLPKICLELGRGVAGQIGHTQPRRIAARTVAERIAEELGTELGAAVGYKVRFTDTASDEHAGQGDDRRHPADRDAARPAAAALRHADHRRGARAQPEHRLHPGLPAGSCCRAGPTSRSSSPRPPSTPSGSASTSATRRWSRCPGGPTRSRCATGRWPTRTSPGRAADQIQGILDAVDELRRDGPGDILVFLSGEREIRDTADALADADGLEVLPLYARLSAAEQHRVFQPHPRRRVVLATNVAETSLTVPGIQYVIDPGTARISRYSHRTKVQRLPIEPISQASANQRTGRCGRTADGICIRLYSEDDFAARPEFTEPEILRTNLASVILRMAALDLGEIADFPFVDPPDARNVADGIRLLHELGAVTQRRAAARSSPTSAASWPGCRSTRGWAG